MNHSWWGKEFFCEKCGQQCVFLEFRFNVLGEVMLIRACPHCKTIYDPEVWSIAYLQEEARDLDFERNMKSGAKPKPPMKAIEAPQSPERLSTNDHLDLKNWGIADMKDLDKDEPGDGPTSAPQQ